MLLRKSYQGKRRKWIIRHIIVFLIIEFVINYIYYYLKIGNNISICKLYLNHSLLYGFNRNIVLYMKIFIISIQLGI